MSEQPEQVAMTMHHAHDFNLSIGDEPVKKQVGAADQISQTGADIVADGADLRMIDQHGGCGIQTIKNPVRSLPGPLQCN